MIAWTRITKSLLSSLYKGRYYPSLAKRGEGRFSETICLLNDALLIMFDIEI